MKLFKTIIEIQIRVQVGINKNWDTYYVDIYLTTICLADGMVHYWLPVLDWLTQADPGGAPGARPHPYQDYY